MRQGYLSWDRHPAAPAHARKGACVMRRAKGSFPQKASVFRQHSGNAVNFRNFHFFFLGHPRQNPRNSAGQHGFAGTGRSDHKEIVHSCNCDLAGSFHCLLAADIRKIRLTFFLSERKDSISPAVFSFSFPCIEKSNCICQASYTDHPDIFHDQRFIAVFLRHHAGCKAVLLCCINHG